MSEAIHWKPIPENQKKAMWINCRAKAGCEGKEATLVMTANNPGGGRILRYRCMTCKGTWHLPVGGGGFN